MNLGKTATANRHMQTSTLTPDELLVSAPRSLWGLLKRGTSALGRQIFRSSDHQARQYGWQVTPRRGGLSRTYRDPRFDYLIACRTCGGHGRNPHGVNCSDCQGTGRISLDSDVISKPRREQS